MARYALAPGYWHADRSMPNGPYGPAAVRPAPGYWHSTMSTGPQEAAALSAYIGGNRASNTSPGQRMAQRSFNNSAAPGGYAMGTGTTGGGYGGDLFNAYQQKLDEANAKNEQRYAEAKNILQGNVSRINQRTDQDRQDLNEYFSRQEGARRADAASRGVGNSSVTWSQNALADRERNAAQRRLSDDRINQLNAANTQVAGLVERRNDIAPDFGQMLQLAQAYGNSGAGGYALGGPNLSPIGVSPQQFYGMGGGGGGYPIAGGGLLPAAMMAAMGSLGSTPGGYPMTSGASGTNPFAFLSRTGPDTTMTPADVSSARRTTEPWASGRPNLVYDRNLKKMVPSASPYAMMPERGAGATMLPSPVTSGYFVPPEPAISAPLPTLGADHLRVPSGLTLRSTPSPRGSSSPFAPTRKYAMGIR